MIIPKPIGLGFKVQRLPVLDTAHKLVFVGIVRDFDIKVFSTANRTFHGFIFSKIFIIFEDLSKNTAMNFYKQFMDWLLKVT